MAPPKNKADANVMFLYLCLMNSGKEIDFNAVAEATNLNVPAARMRYYRLKKVLDPQIVDGKADLTKAAAGDGDASEASAAPSPKKPRVTKRKKAEESTVKSEDEA